MLPESLELFSCCILDQSFPTSFVLFVLTFKILDFVFIWLLWDVSAQSFSMIVDKIADIFIAIGKDIRTFTMHHVMAEISFVYFLICELALSKSVFFSVDKIAHEDFPIRVILFTISVRDVIDCNSFKYGFIRELKFAILFFRLWGSYFILFRT